MISKKNTNIVFVYILIFLCLFKTAQLVAQNNDTVSTIPKIELWGYGGYLFAHHEEMDDMTKHPYIAGELRMSFQTTGKEYWHELFKYPISGFGIYSGTFNNEVLGNPYAVFGFIEFPFIRKEKFYMSTSWSGGLGFHMNEYDSISNVDNVAIGSDVNAYIDFSLLFRYKIGARWELGTGIKLQHFSNGATKYPNYGLNLVSGTAALSYYPGRTIEKFYKGSMPKAYKKHEIFAMYAGGIQGKNQEEPDVRYYNSTVSLGVSRRVSQRRNIGIGMDIFYTESLKNEIEKDPEDISTNELMSYSVFLSSDLIVNKFRFITQFGVYVWQSGDYTLPFYERVGVRYYFIPNMFANVSIKAHAARAQFIEWGIGASF